ncbi:hypothetical protein HGRIS_008158 [Hohenbuehelia grisea]|uniref:RRM domain-containing protein n=1 Tax=Hohenbuehelia grisea TaxID=104357 RepID=A0ABR3J756_9AGAR
MAAPAPLAEMKLTKKQKKSLAFRERGSKGKSKSSNADHDAAAAAADDGILDVPVAEDQDQAMAEVQEGVSDTSPPRAHRAAGDAQDKPSRRAGEKKRARGEVEAVVGPEKTKKRKREAAEEEGASEAVVEGVETKKRKTKAKKPADKGEGGTEDAEEKDEAKDKGKQRLILFVGNLKYTTSLELIQKHFSECNPQPTVRLLTPKPSAGSARTPNKSKGCAFLEFSQKTGLQQALKLHQSELDGRRINVELTAGGGGKSDKRLTKLRERNKELDEQRRKRSEKEGSDQVAVPQRYSATSGVRQAPSKKRTWSVGDTVDDGPTHRGGQKHSRLRKSKAKHLGTGVNAIPVG